MVGPTLLLCSTALSCQLQMGDLECISRTGFRLDGLHQEACMVPAPSTDNEETQTDGEASMPDRTAAKSKTVSLAPGQRFDQASN